MVSTRTADAVAWRPRLRDSVIVQRDGGEAIFIVTGSRMVKRFAVSELVFQLIPLLDGTRTVEQLIDLLCTGSREAIEELNQALAVMRSERLLSLVDDPDAWRVDTGAGLDRYDRQIRFFQDLCDEGLSDNRNGLDLQRCLASTSVVVCGVGGLGCWVLQSLAAMGVGTLRICDADHVEVSNLSRQILFTNRDVGRRKVEAAKDRLQLMNPDLHVETFHRAVTSAADLYDVVDGADLVIGCADQPSPYEVAGWIAEACWPTIPHIVGGAYAYHVGVLGTTVVPGRTACWRCVQVETTNDHGRNASETMIGRRVAGVSAPMSGLVGVALAWEALRVLTGLPSVLADRWTELDNWTLQTASRAIPRRPDCSMCGTEGRCAS